jgi:hypothetical protein
MAALDRGLSAPNAGLASSTTFVPSRVPCVAGAADTARATKKPKPLRQERARSPEGRRAGYPQA